MDGPPDKLVIGPAGLAWPALLSLAAAELFVRADMLEPVRGLFADLLLLRLDEVLVLALCPLIAVLVTVSRSRRSLRLAASRREAERDAARRLASHDPLTGLLNRRGLNDALLDLASSPQRVFLADIDGFKLLNDDQGHACGDLILQQLGTRLRRLVVQYDVLAARLGGDEFIVVAECRPGVVEAVQSALTSPLTRPDGAGSEVFLSVGFSDIDEGGFAHALERADAEMYEAKRRISLGEVGGTRVFEAQLATSPEPAEGFGVVAIAVNRTADNGRPMSYGQAGPLTRAVLTEIRRALPALSVERLSNDVLGVAAPMSALDEVTRALRELHAICTIDDVEQLAKLTLGRAGPTSRRDLREVVEQAQLAVERARRSGRDLVDFEESDRVAMRANAALLCDLRTAIKSEELELHFQPKLNLRTNEIDSLEALVRWTHPVSGPIAPSHFIPLAEDSGDIHALTHLVFKAACEASSTLQQGGLLQPIYVNVSALLIADDTFVSGIISHVAASGARIGIEVTETACLQQPQRALANLKRLAEASVLIAIDDYGVGLSSLTYLRQMPATELKIDMSFIRDLSESHRDPLIVRSTIDLAHGLGLRVTAEGVERAETLGLLKIMGCDHVQGFHIAPAYALPKCIDFLNDWVAPDLQLPDYAAELRRFVKPAR